MAVMIIRHKVKDFAVWKKAFDAHRPTREGTGLTSSRVLRSDEDPNQVILIFDGVDIVKAKAFVASSELQSAMAAAGVADKPDVYFLNAAD